MMRERLLDAFYPPDVACPLCGADVELGSDGVCDCCRQELVYCTSAQWSEPLDGLVAPFLYEDPIRKAVHRFKYKRQTYLARLFALHIKLPAEWEIDCIVPVPLHPIRAAIRRYNQSKLLAAALQKHYPHIPMRDDLLKRTRYTKSQTRLSAEMRRKNLRNGFACCGDVRGKHILLIDDVATTRSTLIACAKVLKRHGAARVYAACICSARE